MRVQTITFRFRSSTPLLYGQSGCTGGARPCTAPVQSLTSHVPAHDTCRSAACVHHHAFVDDVRCVMHGLMLLSCYMYCSCFHGRDKHGAVVYYEKLGGVNVEALKKLGVGPNELLWHYMYQVTMQCTVGSLTHAAS